MGWALGPSDELKEKLNTLGLYSRNEDPPAGDGDRPPNTETRFKDQILAHVDITGPNPVEDNQGTDDDYWNHMANIRRAILLRPVLQRHVRIEKKERIEVQESVLNALLKTRKFYHGARSLEAVLAMSAASRYKETGD